MESTDSPEILDRGETSDIPGLRSGDRIDRSGQAWLVYVIDILTVTSPPHEGEPAGTNLTQGKSRKSFFSMKLNEPGR